PGEFVPSWSPANIRPQAINRAITRPRRPNGRPIAPFAGAEIAPNMAEGGGWLPEGIFAPMSAAFDEMNGTDGLIRPAYQELAGWLGEVSSDTLQHRRREAELLFRRIGITFAVYGESESTERLIPFDVGPRILAAKEG